MAKTLQAKDVGKALRKVLGKKPGKANKLTKVRMAYLPPFVVAPPA